MTFPNRIAARVVSYHAGGRRDTRTCRVCGRAGGRGAEAGGGGAGRRRGRAGGGRGGGRGPPKLAYEIDYQDRDSSGGAAAKLAGTIRFSGATEAYVGFLRQTGL